jgi:hypothetical protein
LQFFALQSGIAERNANELRRADHEVHDIADGRYDGRIQKFLLLYLPLTNSSMSLMALFSERISRL